MAALDPLSISSIKRFILELKEMGLNGFKLVKKYEWKFQAQKMKQLYEYALNGKIKPNFIY